ncbi:protein phosphatase 2C domain-containing protein [Streptomyces marincola]|uniref:PPM-type phosphatase domain-containing protein n=1 Tax=Streptomyces marincola TaxID=2878388 RepID=A0A1W7CUT2_9ACTN|nr:protein phosphatase 2C domain-containing protein [Streptomyces marincola]ARQ68574.1 hypothetical protein CAG99_06625 [Streptomyces marincola]
MRVQSATEPGSPGHPNEDFTATAVPAGGTGGALVLLDGVTGPAAESGTPPGGCGHGVAWFAARLGGTLLERCAAARESPLRACLAEAISRCAHAHRAACDLSHPRTPQATVVCARWDEHDVEYLVLSDSVLLIEDHEGAVRPVLDSRLDDLLPAARRLPRAERVAWIESMRNAPGGFFTAAADPAVADRAVTGVVPRGEVRSLAALTDGVGRWVETFRLGGWSDLFTVLAGPGPAEAIRQVRAAELADPDGAAFPRGKAHDDATAVLALL